MIIKSMGRKAFGKTTGLGTRGGGVFSRLVTYMTRADDHESAESVIWHGFYGHAGISAQEIVTEFQRNAARLKERKNGNVLYHEILSFSKGHTLTENELIRSVTDIGHEYLRQRASNQLAFGAVHRDTDHIHLHLMISANEVGKSERVRLAKKDFSDIQKSVEAYTLERYPELGQTKVYDKTRSPERLKTQAKEQAMKSRTGAQSRKESIKSELHQLFERSRTKEEFETLLRDAGMTIYTRGKNQGVVVRDADGQERKHRFSTLGLMEHFEATQKRLEGTTKPTPTTAPTKENDVSEEHPNKSGKDYSNELPDPGAPEVVAYEFLTGKLHEHWHGKQAPEHEKNATYTDPILERANRQEGRDNPSQTSPGDRGGSSEDHER